MKISSLFSIIFIPLFLVSLAGCSSYSSNPEKVGKSNTNQAGNNNQGQAEEKEVFEVYKIGDQVKLDNQILTVLDISEYQSDNEFAQPTEGNKYMAVDVELENSDNQPIDYNVYDFEIQDENSYTYKQALIGDKEPRYSSGTLQPGRKIRGFITFEVPNESARFELIFTPDLFSASQIIIDLTNE
jgi:hypothetical protein